MREIVFATMGALALILSGYLNTSARSDESPTIRHSKKVRPICDGRYCERYAPCVLHCRIACPDGYSCYPLFGAYGPYGGTGYWSGYTMTGWHRGW